MNYLDLQSVSAGGASSLPTAGEVNSAVEEPVGLTSYVDAEDVRGDISVVSMTTDNSLLLGDDQSAIKIDEVLCRPAFMNNITWDSSSAQNSVLASYSLPSDLPAYSAIKKCKMQYNTFMQCDVVFRIEAAPIQFQSGRLYVCFDPYRNERGARSTILQPQSYTALHGITYDPAKPNPVEFRVPYASILSSYDLPLGQYGCGTLLVIVLSPLNSAASTSSVTLSVQAWFENVKLTVPTQAQALNAPVTTRNVHSLEYTHGEPQLFQSNEEALAQRHRFSRAADRVSSIASFLGTFPLLSVVASPVASFAKGVSKVAAAFGFSKPADISCPTKIVSHNRAAWANGDGSLPVVSLSQSSDYAIDHTGRYFPNPVDEMDINYICSNPAMLNAWSWSTSDAVGKVVTVIPVHPGLCNRISGPETQTFGVYAPTPMAYVASMFKYWGGSLKYKLDAVSTPFHAGRLLVAYIPDYDPSVTLTINEIGNNYSVLWDITDSSTLEFEVPYLGNTPYLNVFLDDQAYSGIIDSTASAATNAIRIRSIQNGAIIVFVLNQLVSPSTAAATIPVQNWIAGGKDLTFAEPVFGVYTPSANYTVRADNTAKLYDGTALSAPATGVTPTRLAEIREEEDEEEPQVFQSDAAATKTDASAASKTDAPTGRSVSAPSTSKTAPTGITPFLDAGGDSFSSQLSSRKNFIPMHYVSPEARAKLVTGEVITNLRQLTRRLAPAFAIYPHDVVNLGAWDTAVTPLTSNHVLAIDPDYFGSATGQGDSCVFRTIAACTTSSTDAKWITECTSPLSYISYLYCFARGSRRYAISSQPSNVINAAKFTTFCDETDPTADSGVGTFDLRMSMHSLELIPPLQPWFIPEWGAYGYGFDNSSSSTVPQNSQSGLNSIFSGNPALQKSGEAGCGVVVSVPSTSRYPIKLITSMSDASIADYVKSKSTNAPRSRRFLEIRYKPFSTSISGTTGTFTPKLWPFPTTILEAGGDDFSFGGLVPPPLLTRTTKALILPSVTTGIRKAF